MREFLPRRLLCFTVRLLHYYFQTEDENGVHRTEEKNADHESDG